MAAGVQEQMCRDAYRLANHLIHPRGEPVGVFDNENVKYRNNIMQVLAGEPLCSSFNIQMRSLAHLFHGILASIMPMPHVSVRPAKTSPAPTKAERPKK
jgi:hypothetical protein